ncbi:MAG TPA: serine/threonine-protein kinase [Longimicrobiaceae bacterium]
MLESLTERPLTAVVVAGAPSPGKRNVADPLSPANSSRPDPAGTPRVIADRYQILRLLGEGASARTLLCSDLRENRRVAIKELHLARLGDWKHLELFEREARTLSKLDHPGIPKVFAFFEGEGDAATFYLVQEFIEGQSLQQRMDSGPLPGRKEVLDLTLGLLDVLEYLHGRVPPVIHRDLKPSNVLLRPGGTPALVDFGGVNLGWQPAGATRTTVVGTFGYMAPEQLVGQGGPGSDLYSLGATLLHVVTGRPPSDFPFDGGRIEVPDNLPVDPPLRRLIAALLHPAPRDRPQTAETARRILTEPAQERSTSVSHHRVVVPAPAPTPPRSLLGIAGEPRFVDMADPPRDPGGELRDVYRNLMHPLFPARRAWSGLEHLLWLGISGATAVVTLGGITAAYAWGVKKRRREYDDLFRNGRFTVGTIRAAVPTGGIYAVVRYEFEADGVYHVGSMRCAQEMTRYWGPGDVVSVLYDPEEPTRSCIVYR